jgi:hypothetical protein
MLAVTAVAYRRLQSSVDFGSAAWPTQWSDRRVQVWSKCNLGTQDPNAAEEKLLCKPSEPEKIFICALKLDLALKHLSSLRWEVAHGSEQR